MSRPTFTQVKTIRSVLRTRTSLFGQQISPNLCANPNQELIRTEGTPTLGVLPNDFVPRFIGIQTQPL